LGSSWRRAVSRLAGTDWGLSLRLDCEQRRHRDHAVGGVAGARQTGHAEHPLQGREQRVVVIRSGVGDAARTAVGDHHRQGTAAARVGVAAAAGSGALVEVDHDRIVAPVPDGRMADLVDGLGHALEIASPAEACLVELTGETGLVYPEQPERVVAVDPEGAAPERGHVVGTAGMADRVVLRGQPVGAGQGVDGRRGGVADDVGEAVVLLGQHEHVVVVRQAARRAPVAGGRGGGGRDDGEPRGHGDSEHCRQPRQLGRGHARSFSDADVFVEGAVPGAVPLAWPFSRSASAQPVSGIALGAMWQSGE
jgi:hypothetical protein